VTYPHDWGFVPSNKADDADPLDIMVIHDAGTFPGIELTRRIIGILQIEQRSKAKAERNDRPVARTPSRAFATYAPFQSRFSKSLRVLRCHDELEDKILGTIGWKGTKIAMKAIKDSARISSKNDHNFSQ
jgi:inorganic pyrophosphatase